MCVFPLRTNNSSVGRGGVCAARLYLFCSLYPIFIYAINNATSINGIDYITVPSIGPCRSINTFFGLATINNTLNGTKNNNSCTNTVVKSIFSQLYYFQVMGKPTLGPITPKLFKEKSQRIPGPVCRPPVVPRNSDTNRHRGVAPSTALL